MSSIMHVVMVSDGHDIKILSLNMIEIVTDDDI